MFLLIQAWPFVAAAALVGLAVALFAPPGRDLRRGEGVAAIAVPVLAGGALLVASGLHLVRGAAGLWLDLAVPIVGAYAAGYVVGTGLWMVARARRAPPAQGATDA